MKKENLSKIVMMFALIFSLVSCKEDVSNQAAKDYDSSKAKWNSMKNSISSYKIVASGSSIVGWSTTTIEIDLGSTSVTSCKILFGDWGVAKEDGNESDCLSDSTQHLFVEDYFSRMESLLSSEGITSYKFDATYGVPLYVYGQDPSASCADCSRAGFTIEFYATPK